MSATIESRGRPGVQFTNWATTVSCQPELYFEPEKTDDIKEVLVAARRNGKKVKVVGEGHSFTDLMCTTDYLISLKRYNQVLQIDRKTGLVKVQGGCLLSDLIETVLPEHGLAFSVLPIITDVTMAGLISTGSHGTGANMEINSSFVTELELMTSSGEILTISKEQNSDLYSAAVVSLGCLGIILNITFQCEPAFDLEYKQFPDKLNNVVHNLNKYINGSEHFHFCYFPHTDGILCCHANRTSKARTVVRSNWFWDIFIGYYMFQYAYWFGSFFMFLIPTLHRIFYKLLFDQKTERVDRSDKIFAIPVQISNASEWAIPCDKIGSVLKEIEKWIVKNNVPVLIPVFVRFAKGDNLMLSTAYGWKTASYINILTDIKTFPEGECWREFEEIMSRVGGRPHWGKKHQYGREEFKKIYPEFETFSKIRKRLDPTNMFLNCHLEKIFN